MAIFKIARRGNLQARRSNLFARHSAGSALSTKTVDVLSATVQSFGTYAAGTYVITYVSGAMDFGGQGPRLQYADASLGQYVVYNGGTAEVQGPGDSAIYGTGADCQASNIGAQITIIHTGGTIGVYCKDTGYGNNLAATDVGAPTFELSQ